MGFKRHSPHVSFTGPDDFRGYYRTIFSLSADRRESTFILGHPVKTSGKPGDPRENRCRDLAQSWGHGKATVVYLNPHRVNNYRELQAYPEGTFPRIRLFNMTRSAIHFSLWTGGAVVAAWGIAGKHAEQGDQMMRWLAMGGTFQPFPPRKPLPAYALGFTAEGYPADVLDPAASDQLVPLPLKIERAA